MNLSLNKLFTNKRGKKGIDGVVFASGGKDSCYALKVVSEHVRDPSRIIAITMDNGFLSEGARNNIQNISKRFGTQQKFWGIDKKILFSFYRKLTRAGPDNPRSVCVGCNVLSGRMEQEALHKYQPAFVVTGNNSIEYDLFKKWLRRSEIEETGSGNEEFEFRHGFWAYNERILTEIVTVESPEYNALSIPEPKIDDEIAQCERVNVFDYVPYNQKEIFETLKKLGWRHPGDVVGTETDCRFTQAITHAYIVKYSKMGYKKFVEKLVRKDRLDAQTGQRAIEG